MINSMTQPQRVRRLLASLVLSAACAFLTPVLPAWAQAQRPTEVALAPAAALRGDQLAVANDLVKAGVEKARAGQFDQSADLFSKAYELNKSPSLEKLVKWSKDFNAQREHFVTERRKEYDKAISKVKLLQEKSKPIYAMEMAGQAYLLADNKDAFRAEPWVTKLLTEAKTLAAKYEREEQWLNALRLYSQLSSIEVENPQWKEELKVATRRIRLLALYTPEELKRIQSQDSKEREEVEALLAPTTKPTTKPANKDEDEEAEKANRLTWRDALRDVRISMLEDALINTRQNYYKDVSYQKVLLGGLEGLRVLIRTPALGTEFPGIKDDKARETFLAFLDVKIAEYTNAAPKDDAQVVRDLLEKLNDQNKDSVKLPEEVLVSEFADGAFGVLDPFSSVIWPTDWEEFQKTTKGEFSGVGIQIQMDEAGNLKVVSPLEDSPAYKAGIKPDYIISKIDGKSARWIGTNRAVKLITGSPDSKVTLTIKDTKGVEKDYVLTRQTIKVASVKGWLHKPGGGWEYFIDPAEKIGYIRMTNFAKTTTADMNRAIKEMSEAGARGIIFDLRYNPGGLLNQAVDVVDRFIDQGPIVSTRPDRPDSPNVSPPLNATKRFGEVTLPLLVLVNQYSASASEIVSGALKDHRRATIVGERTFGKGSVQMLYPLGGAQQAVLKLTTSHYYLPNGKCIHREENSKDWGVEPDLTIEMTPEQMRAAIDARQEMDILRDADARPAQGAQLDEKVQKVDNAVADADAQAKKVKDPLEVDPQLSAALLLMRLELAGPPKQL